MAIRFLEKKFPYLRKKYPKLGTLLLSGAIMWLSKFIRFYIFGINIARGSFCAIYHPHSTTFKSRKFSKFFLSVDSSASSEPDFSMITLFKDHDVRSVDQGESETTKKL